jgi:hypothetical protein
VIDGVEPGYLYVIKAGTASTQRKRVLMNLKSDLRYEILLNSKARHAQVGRRSDAAARRVRFSFISERASA